MHENNTEVLRQINQSYMYVYIDTISHYACYYFVLYKFSLAQEIW